MSYVKYPKLHVQCAANELPIGELESAAHDMQVPFGVTAFWEYVPAGQVVHPTLPVTFLYFPLAQVEQVPPLGPVYPRLQVQLAAAVHPLHEAPEFAGQAVQGPPFGPQNPALQVQPDKAAHPKHEAPEFAGQAI